MKAIQVILQILTIAGSLGLFLYGMKIMSEGLQKVAGDKMRILLGRMTSKPLNGVLTGAGITGVIQSSSATTVMTVGFANAGLLTLSGAIAVVMGANIGTTITAWIISIFGLKFSIAILSVPLIGIALPLIFSDKDKLKSLGEFIVGFALLFLGMEMLKNSIPDIGGYPKLLQTIGNLSNMGYLSVLLFVLIGTLCTVIMQSSSAMMAITLVMCAQGWINFPIAASMVLGENIGTTITANMAAAVANVQAKRVARSHFVFNIIGVLWILIIFYPFLKGVSWLTILIEGQNPYISNEAIPIALSVFHSCFNIINTLILIWFIPQIVKIVSWMVPDKDEEQIETLQYISHSMTNTPELNMECARKEIKHFADRILRMFGFLKDLKTTDEKEYRRIQERISKYEKITDCMELEITNFLVQLQSHRTSVETTQESLSMLREIDNLESLGDAIYQLAKLDESRVLQQLSLPEQELEQISKMFASVEQAMILMGKNLNETDTPDMHSAYQQEEQINVMYKQIHDRHLSSVMEGRYDYVAGTYYNSVCSLLEQMGDYIINVSEGVDNSKKQAKLER